MSDCILWPKAINSSGYGVTWKDGKQVYAHRLVAGAQEGEVVLHTCDNKTCVNPDHLKVGSHAENSKDMVSKNRQAKWEKCARTKFSREIVEFVRKAHGKLSSRELGNLVGMSRTNVLDIWNNNIWKGV